MKFKQRFNRSSQLFYGFILWNTWAIAAMLRFAGLDTFNFLVFDEKYFVKFAHQYLIGGSVFDSHPPLGKYLIALGIWIGDRLPFSHSYIQVADGLISPWSYRWLNALVGSFIPLVIAAIAYQLTHRYSYSIIAGLFALNDGFFLVESRYALINIYMVFFGLLGQLFFLKFMQQKNDRYRWIFLFAAGVNFGASAAVKWNGLGFLLSAYLLWLSHCLYGLCRWFKEYKKPAELPKRLKTINKFYSLIHSQLFLSPWSFVLYLGIVPTVVYGLCWIPHLQMNPDDGFWEVHQQILAYHQNLGSGNDVHPYCSPWWTWPWMIRPMVYFYQTIQLPEKATVIYTVNGMGNPIMWWLSTTAIALFLGLLIQQISIQLRAFLLKKLPREIEISHHPAFLGIGYYLMINYLCNLLPWLLVSRCTFIYHYMSAAVFAQLAIAWFVDYLLQAKPTYWRILAIALIIIIVLAFMFWLPLYIGLPLSPNDWKYRIWLSSWI